MVSLQSALSDPLSWLVTVTFQFPTHPRSNHGYWRAGEPQQQMNWASLLQWLMRDLKQCDDGQLIYNSETYLVSGESSRANGPVMTLEQARSRPSHVSRAPKF